MRYETYWNPGTVRGQRHRSIARRSALRRLLRHPRIVSLLFDEVLPEAIAHPDSDTPLDRGRRLDSTDAKVRQALSELPGVKPWPWLVTELAQFVSVLSLSLAPDEAGDRRRKGTSAEEWAISGGLATVVESVMALDWADAQSQRHLTRAVELEPLNEQFLLPGRGVGVAHEAINRWAADAHAAVEAAGSEPVPRPTRKRFGDVYLWVGWWYRHRVLGETFKTIVESDGADEGVKRQTGYVSRRAGIIQELLDETITEPSPR